MKKSDFRYKNSSEKIQNVSSTILAIAKDICASKHNVSDSNLDDLKRQVVQLKEENEKKQLKLKELETDIMKLKANQELKEEKAIRKELKLIVTELF